MSGEHEIDPKDRIMDLVTELLEAGMKIREVREAVDEAIDIFRAQWVKP